MPDLLGFISIVLVSFLTFIMALRWRKVSTILLVALVVRILFLYINNYFFYLPDGNMDALVFESLAWEWSRDGFFNTFNFYFGPSAHFLSFLIAIPYSLLGRSLLMAQSFSIIFGIASVFLSWIIAKKIWNDKIAIKVAWTVCLFPSLISYSVLVMREAYITFFLLLAFYGLISWFKEKKFKFLILTTFGFIAATFFHGASVLGLFVFIAFVLFNSVKEIFKSIKKKKYNPKSLTLLAFSILFFIFYGIKYETPYIGNFKTMTDLGYLSNITRTRFEGDADYPQWTKINSNIEILYKAPLRTLYFLFSPFPWDIDKPKHFIGFLDSILYIFLFYLIILNIKAIWNNIALRCILIILLFYFFAFSFGVGNFGTGIRHRSKFVIELILLAAPFIPGIVISSKKNLYEYFK